ncbi:MAG: DUF1559 domain-containing protein [Planctomycetota bacterium]|nr:DUF1559 domain-containing protein [Planctomycetota bacterium]MDA1163079.1 DUF1559 domain-containing protein [Planctomycetota bacterium]
MTKSQDGEMKCRNGHWFMAADVKSAGETTICPSCGVDVAAPSSENDLRPRRSLWEVMGHRDEASGEDSKSSESSVGIESEAALTDSEDASSQDTDSSVADSRVIRDSPDKNRPRGLWAVMGATLDTTARQAESDEVVKAYAPTEEADASVDDGGEYDDEDAYDGDDGSEVADDDEEDGWEVESPLTDFDAADPISSAGLTSQERADASALPRGTGALTAGVASVLLSGFTVLPSFVAGIPATVIGAGALVLGYQTLGSNRRHRKSVTQVLAQAGMLLGLVGIFAGPAYLHKLGDSWRNRSTKEVIAANFGAISRALNEYEIEKGCYPAGGIFAIDNEGLEIGMHSWMTSLLPHIGQIDVYDAIDQSKPWNDQANRAVMSRPIPSFLIPDGNSEPTGQGLATTHFAGVGGVIQTEQGLLPTGIFNKNSAVTSTDISDGLSQTIIVGEIARALPAWGDPENWRTVDSPLNKRLSSFGNTAGSGAHFLLGDGSVRFFSNRTSPELLQQLATRNASD